MSPQSYPIEREEERPAFDTWHTAVMHAVWPAAMLCPPTVHGKMRQPRTPDPQIWDETIEKRQLAAEEDGYHGAAETVDS
jgi:hypothetical protein